MNEAAPLIPGQGERTKQLISVSFSGSCYKLNFERFLWMGAALNFLCLCRPGTSIAAAVGGVVLFIILLALLVFYLRRQKKLKRKETMRRILQEHEVRDDVPN